MRSAKHLLPFLVVLGALVACRVSEDSASVAKLRWVEHADPIVDAQNALASNDHRLVGVYGYVISIPGVEMSQWPTYQQRYGLRPIEGTSDTLEEEEHSRLVRKATKYAEHYNKHVLTHVKLP
ncbi:MAG: hypothetical protein ACREQW_22325 [Candidatus Binatia bacterium]